MNTPLVIGALIVSIVIIFAMINIVKTTIQTAFIIGVVIFGLQVLFKVGPLDVFKQVQGMVAGLFRWLSNWGNRYKPSENRPETLLWLIPIVLEALEEFG